jgi:hypothetical protein
MPKKRLCARNVLFAELFKRGNFGVALRDINSTKCRRTRRQRIRARKMRTKRLINDPQKLLAKNRLHGGNTFAASGPEALKTAAKLNGFILGQLKETIRIPARKK